MDLRIALLFWYLGKVDYYALSIEVQGCWFDHNNISLEIRFGVYIHKRPILCSKKKGPINGPFLNIGSPGRTRTADQVVNSHPLYRLSYRGMITNADFGINKKIIPNP